MLCGVLSLQAGMNVMVVIHQPRYSIFEMFDSVLLLGVGGRTVFLGPVSLARKYFFFLGFRPPPGENRAGEVQDLQPFECLVRLKCNTVPIHMPVVIITRCVR